MTTIGWLFILVAVLIARAVAKGRALSIPEDLGNAFQAFINGDYDSVAAAFNATGDTATFDASAFGSTVAANVGDITSEVSKTQGSTNQNIAYWAYQLGRTAKGYRFGAAGPDYYDCSGLMYRAVQKVGYGGPRFFTGTVAAMPGMHRISTTLGQSKVIPGDLVVWPGHHMGVFVGQNKMYSAQNPRVGIKESPIQDFRKGEDPIYIRFTG